MSTLRIGSAISALIRSCIAAFLATAVLAIAVLATAAPATAQAPPNLHDASVHQAVETPRSFTDLAKAQPDGWSAWSVPTASKHSICCQDGDSCTLQAEHGFTMQRRQQRGSADVQVFLRQKQGQVEVLRYFSSDCPIDAAGKKVTWFGSVAERTSLNWLIELGERETEREIRERVLAGVSVHADLAADDILLRVARGQLPWQLEEEAIFWLGAEREDHGFALLQQLEDELPANLRRQVAFAFHLSDAKGATPALINMARHDSIAEVRSQALFWLGQEAGEKVVSVLEEAVHEDPEVEVREHAIFALSQMSEGRGVPHLIRFAREHRMPQVRQKALFWLGQSEDPRALALFEEILLD